MAEAGQRLIKQGMFVICENKLCQVEKSVNELGFNRYIVVAVDSGEKYNKLRFELEVEDMSFVNEQMEFDEPTVNDPTEQKMCQEKDKKRRFETINDEDLNKLALNRNSKHTRTQTAWGVAVFKGKYQKMTHRSSV